MTWKESDQDRAAFVRVRNAENAYSRRLRKLATHIYDLVFQFVQDPEYHEFSELEALLIRYADFILPWARNVSQRFIAEVSRRDEKAWAVVGKKISRGLQQEILSAPTGDMLREFLETQVQLITSLPLDAAQRVHEIAIGNLYTGARASELSKHIMETGKVVRSRADLIARTETARVSASLTMARAQYIGSEGYIWRSVLDHRTRPTHKAMEGKFIRWDDPPDPENDGNHYHAGMVWNCRCYADVSIPDKFL